jgi:hypothetical protein
MPRSCDIGRSGRAANDTVLRARIAQIVPVPTDASGDFGRHSRKAGSLLNAVRRTVLRRPSLRMDAQN